MKVKSEKTKGLAKLFFLLKTEKEFVSLLEELLTDSEIDKLHERVRVMERLKKGDSHRQAAKASSAAIATVTRGAALMKGGKLTLFDLIEKAGKMNWWKKLFWRA